MSLLEPTKDTWDKRFKADHYSYRDFLRVTPVAQAEAASLALILAQMNAAPPTGNTYYQFGLNARGTVGAPNPNLAPAFLAAIGIANPGPYFWPYGVPIIAPLLAGAPARGDAFGPNALTIGYPHCFARDVLCYTEHEAYIRFICLNPEFLRQAVIFARVPTQPVTAYPFIWEQEKRVPDNQLRRYHPTYGLGIGFRTPVGVVPTVLEVDIEGNVEGSE